LVFDHSDRHYSFDWIDHTGGLGSGQIKQSKQIKLGQIQIDRIFGWIWVRIDGFVFRGIRYISGIFQ